MKNCLVIIIMLSCIHMYAQKSQYLEVSDHNMHFKTFGTGEPLLIINGGSGMNSEGFDRIASELASEFGLLTIIYDQRGTGKSILKGGLSKEKLILDLMINDLEQLRIHLGFEQWMVMGQSFGGMLASYYAAKHPNGIKKLILSSSGGVDLDLMNSIDVQSRLTVTEKDSLNYWTNKINQGDTSAQATLMRAKYLAPAYVINESYIMQIAERLIQVNMEVNAMVFNNLVEMQFDCKRALSLFEAPTLIIQGKEDIISTDLSKKAHTIFPNSQLILLDNCGHYGWLDQKEQYFKSISNFLKS